MPRARSPRRTLLRLIREIRTSASDIQNTWDVSSHVARADGTRAPRELSDYPENRVPVIQATIAELMRVQRLAADAIAGLQIERQRLEEGTPRPAAARISRVRLAALQVAVDKYDGDTLPLQLPARMREGLLRNRYIDFGGRVTERGRAVLTWAARRPTLEQAPQPAMCATHPAFESDYCPGCGNVPKLH